PIKGTTPGTTIGHKPKLGSLKSFLDAIDNRVALNWTEGTQEEFHNSRIGIHCGERFPILVTPSTQADAAAGQCHKGAHRCTILCLKTCDTDRPGGSFSDRLRYPRWDNLQSAFVEKWERRTAVIRRILRSNSSARIAVRVWAL